MPLTFIQMLAEKYTRPRRVYFLLIYDDQLSSFCRQVCSFHIIYQRRAVAGVHVLNDAPLISFFQFPSNYCRSCLRCETHAQLFEMIPLTPRDKLEADKESSKKILAFCLKLNLKVCCLSVFVIKHIETAQIANHKRFEMRCKQVCKEVSLSSEAIRCEKIVSMHDTLRPCNKLIPWKDFFPSPECVHIPSSTGGRPLCDDVLLFRRLMLHKFLQLSNKALVCLRYVRSGFKKFLCTKVASIVPSDDSIRRFWELQKQRQLHKLLFDLFHRHSQEKGLIVNCEVALTNRYDNTLLLALLPSNAEREQNRIRTSLARSLVG